jgi:hypothetical protein
MVGGTESEFRRQLALCRSQREQTTNSSKTKPIMKNTVTILCAVGLFFATAGEAQSAYLYFAEFNGGTIRRANLDGTGQKVVITGLSIAAGPALDLVGGKMYYCDLGSGVIRRSNLDGTGQTNLVRGRNGPDGPALDFPGGRMYWSDSSGGEIRRANLDGSDQQVLVKGQNDPHAVVLDLTGRTMYWPDYNAGEIRRANLDGTGLASVLKGLSNPALMTLDVPGGKITGRLMGPMTFAAPISTVPARKPSSATRTIPPGSLSTSATATCTGPTTAAGIFAGRTWTARGNKS